MNPAAAANKARATLGITNEVSTMHDMKAWLQVSVGACAANTKCLWHMQSQHAYSAVKDSSNVHIIAFQLMTSNLLSS